MIILIATCKHYVDIIPYFADFLNKNWQTKFRKVLINCPLEFTGYDSINLEQDYGWTKNILTFIDQYHIDENLLLLHDDYILTNRIDDARIAEADKDTCGKIGYIRLIRYSDNAWNEGHGWKWPSYQPYNDKYNFADRAYDLQPGDWYETRLIFSHQPAIWNINFVKEFFCPDRSPWQQEVLGSREFMRDGTIAGKKCDYEFLTLKDDYFMYCNAVRDGKYSADFFSLLAEHGIKCPTIRESAGKFNELCWDARNEILQRQTDGSYPKAYL